MGITLNRVLQMIEHAARIAMKARNGRFSFLSMGLFYFVRLSNRNLDLLQSFLLVAQLISDNIVLCVCPLLQQRKSSGCTDGGNSYGRRCLPPFPSMLMVMGE